MARFELGGQIRSALGPPAGRYHHMIVLGIDTATTMVSVAVVDGATVLASSELRSDRRHAEDLTPMIDFVVKRAGLSFADLDAVAVDVGPGLFTGMRVGIASAQALAFALSIPLVGVDGLEALVAAIPEAVAKQAEVIVPTIDARRREVAWAMHSNVSGRVLAPRVGGLDDLLAGVRERGQHCLFVGDFARRHRDDIVAGLGPHSWNVSFGDETLDWPIARHVAFIGHERALHLDGGARRAPRAEALYLREADAEINWTTRSSA
ncbi:MAG: tRNA (adenosine(37)-N6)-threonylcarbamoyltransferase complex dimerization subunit type 1 TsaB [Ilumatobacteraceae bacterium]